MTTAVIVTGAEPADEGAVFFVHVAAASITGWAAEPWSLSLSAAASGTEGRFEFELDGLLLAAEVDDDFRSAQATDADDGVIFQKLVIGPFPRPGVT